MNFSFGFNQSGAKHRQRQLTGNLPDNVRNRAGHDLYGVAVEPAGGLNTRLEGLGIDHEDLENGDQTAGASLLQNLLFR